LRNLPSYRDGGGPEERTARYERVGAGDQFEVG